MTPTTPETAAGKRTPLLPLLGWLGFVVLAMYALMIGGGYEGIHDVDWRVISLGLISLTLIGWAVSAVRRPEWRPGTAIWPALVAPLAALVVSQLLAAYPRLGIEYVAWAFLLVAVYLLLVRILRTEFVRARIGGLALVLGLVVGFVYLAVVVLLWLDWWEVLGRFAVPPLRPAMAGLTFGGPNVVASVMVLITVLAAVGLGRGSRGRIIAVGVLAVIAAAVVVISGSRSAWIGLAGAFVLVGGLRLILERGSVANGLRDRRALALIGGALGAVALAALVLGPTLLDRLLNAGTGGRPSYWAAALRMFEDAPLTGLGPGAWAANRLAYLRAGEDDFSVPHAHNLYLQTAAETGLLGLAVGLIAAVAAGWLLYSALRSGDGVRRTWAWATLFGAIYLGLVNGVDFYANLPGVVMLWIIPLAMLDGRTSRGIGVPHMWARTATGRLATITLALACAASILVLSLAESTAGPFDRAVAHADASEWAEARSTVADVIEADAAQPGHQLLTALAAMEAGDWDTAADAYESSLEVDDLPHAWAGLAQATLERGGGPDSVVPYLEAAMRLGEQDAHVSLAVAFLYERLGFSDEADEAMATTIALQPSLAAAPEESQEIEQAERLGQAVARATELAGGNGWRVALAAGDIEHAHELLGDAGDAFTHDLIDAWGGDAAALARLQAAADAEPQSAGHLSLAAAVTDRAGDPKLADRYRRLALFQIEGESIVGLPVRVAESCEEGTPVPSRMELHGLWGYRRDLPRTLLPVGAPCMLLDAEPR